MSSLLVSGCPHNELLRKAVGKEHVSQMTQEEKNMAPKRVTPEEFRVNQQIILDADSSKFHSIVTSPEDMKTIETLLEMKFPCPYVVRTTQPNCSNCGRENNFLDVVATALESKHSPEFLRDVFTGKYGPITNTSKEQRCVCYQCKVELPRCATKYSAPTTLLPSTTDGKSCPYVYVPIYNYRF